MRVSYSFRKWIVIATLMLFVVSRFFDLHVHGHVESEHHHANEAGTHQHSGSWAKTHLVSALDHASDLTVTGDPHHGKMTFDIEPDLAAKKPSSSFFSKLIYFLSVFAVSLFTLWLLSSQRSRFDEWSPLPQPYSFSSPPRRGPPLV